VAENQTIVLGVPNLGPQNVDPIAAHEAGSNYPIKWSVGEPLVRLDLDMKPVPALAETWEVSEDKLTWTFELREGVKMHDGSEFTAADVATAISRVQENEDLTAYATYAARIDSVNVVDDYKVEVTTTEPYAALPL